MLKATAFILLIASFALYSQTTFMRTYGSDDYGSNVIQTSDGGFLFSGWSHSQGNGGWDTRLLKTDEKGDVLWESVPEGAADDYVEGLLEIKDGHYLLVQYTASNGASGLDIQLIKMNHQGETVWQQMYSLEKDQRCFEVAQMQDGGFVIAGQSNVGSNVQNCFIIRTDAAGNRTWDYVFKDDKSNDFFRDVIATSDGGFALAGTKNGRFFVAKYKDDNTVEWGYKFGDESCMGTSLVQLNDGGYMVVGLTTTSWFSLSSDVLVIRMDAQGNELWKKKYGGAKSDGATLAKKAPDGNVVLVGWTGSYSNNGLFDLLLMKANLDGDIEWEQHFDRNLREEGYGLDTTDDGGLVVAGSATLGSFLQNGKIWLIRTNSEGQVLPEFVQEKPIIPQMPTLFQNYPNPFNPTTTIEYSLPQPGRATVSIHNISGQRVRTLVDAEQSAGTHTVLWDAADDLGTKVSSGLYFYRIQVIENSEGKEAWRAEKKMLLLK